MEKRSSKYTPALTTAAACRNADTGVAAAMASGSQKWNGNCAALVNAENAISRATTTVTLLSPHTSAAKMSVSRVVPAWMEATARPAKSVRPPKKVRIRVRYEPASPDEPERAISMNDAMETSSQAMKSSTASSASTSNSTDSVKAVMMV